MTRFVRPFLIALCLLTLAGTATAQSGASAQPNSAKKPIKDSGNSKAAKDAEAERIFKERRAQVQSLLISLAADAGSYNDQTLRARTQARIADALWEVDAERGRTLFRKAWDAAEIADKESKERQQQDIRQQQSKSGGYAITAPPNIRAEVLRLAARRDRALGEELLGKLREQKAEEVADTARNERGNPFGGDDAVRQRLTLARQLLSTDDVERALQFADPALIAVTMDTIDFLCYLRDKNPTAADERYARFLRMAEADFQSDANTASLLSSYIFTPHLFVTFERNGGQSSMQSSQRVPPPNVAPELRLAFLRTAASILLRPLPPPEQDHTTTGVDGKYMAVKRMLPLFDQFAPRETADLLRGQLEALGSISQARNSNEDAAFGPTVREGIDPEIKAEDREQALLDRIDRAKTAEDRDAIRLQLAILVAQRGDLRARDLADKIDDSELRKDVKPFIDMTLAMRLVNSKETDKALALVRVGEFTGIQKTWLLTQVAELIAKTDRDKALELAGEAATEARRIDASDPDRPRALTAVANAFAVTDRARMWETMVEVAKAANSAPDFTGEDGRLLISLNVKTMRSIRNSTVDDFDLQGIYRVLARENLSQAVELARQFEREGPRASSVIAIARAVLSEKQK
jgi:hypothetical protein